MQREFPPSYIYIGTLMNTVTAMQNTVGKRLECIMQRESSSVHWNTTEYCNSNIDCCREKARLRAQEKAHIRTRQHPDVVAKHRLQHGAAQLRYRQVNRLILRAKQWEYQYVFPI
jgi:hypothetical protein